MNKFKCIFFYVFVFMSALSAKTEDLNKSGESCILEPFSTQIPPDNSKSVSDKLLQELEGLYGKRYDFEDGDMKYEMTFCGDVRRESKMATITRTKKSQNIVNVLGLRNRTRTVAKAGNTYMLQFDGYIHDNDSIDVLANCPSVYSTLFILCDPNSGQGLFRFVAVDDVYCSFTFELKLEFICEQHGLGTWSIIFIILLVLFLVYLLIGIAYMRFVVGAKGMEQMPNRLMWISVGESIADFADLICRCGRYCGVRDGSVHSDYSPIGGATGGSSPFVDQDTGLLRP